MHTLRNNPLVFLLAVIPQLLLLALTPTPLLAMPPGMAGEGGPQRHGTVVETINSAGYTYLLVADALGQTWVAIPETEVAAGSDVSYYDGMVMENFTSNSLNRTFATIIFSPGLAPAAAAPLPAATPATSPEESFAAAIQAEASRPVPVAPAAMGESSGGSLAAVVPFTEVAIDKAGGGNGYTVAEIFARAGELAGQKVQVRGKVVKFSPQIMGRNWLRLQDGSGDPMQNTHDLVVTSNETVATESIVTVEGILAADRDFGAGYRYQAIVEEAVVVQP
jgi:hypothetical protein